MYGPDSMVHVIKSNDGICEEHYQIPAGDFIMLLNYYRYIKDKNIYCDFINPNGKNPRP